MATGWSVDWNSPIKLLVSAVDGTFKKNDISILLEAINNGETCILGHEEDEEAFYSSFVALSTHYICYSIGSLYKSNLKEVSAACKVLLKYLLKRLQKHHEGCVISQNNLMVLIRSLCKGSSSLSKSDVVTYTGLLKAAKSPATEKPEQDGEDVTATPDTKELSRPRLDTGLSIYTQMTSIFHELPSPSSNSKPSTKLDSPLEKLNSDGDMTIIHIAEPGDELVSIFASRNVLSLQQLGGGDVLLDVCMELQSLKSYADGVQKALLSGQPLEFSTTVMEAMCVRSMLQPLVSDISIVCRVGSLPVIEPLTPSRLHKIVSITLACLYAALATTTATSIVTMATGAQMKGMACNKDEELDNYAATIVQKTLEIHTALSMAIKNSTRVGSQCLQNFQMISSWLLFKGLHHIITLTPATIFEKGKDTPAKPVSQVKTDSLKPKETSGRPTSSSAKSYAGFGMLSVAMASQAISVVTALMEDLQLENMAVSREPPGPPDTKAVMSLDGDYSALQRILLLTDSVDLNGLLVGLLSVTLKKAVSLKKPKQRHQSERSSESSCGSSSDSNTYYEDDFSSPEDSSEDEDDDYVPILGHWFEETLSPEEPVVSSQQGSKTAPGDGETEDDDPQKRTHRLNSSDSPCLIPDKRDPEGYVALASDILHFFNGHCLSASELQVKDYFRNSLSDQHMGILAALIRDIDKDFPRLEDASLSEEFSSALAKFTHNMVANEILSTALQDTLLLHLGLGLHDDHMWPLRAYPRSLAVLAEIILLRQQREREGSTGSIKGQTEAIIVRIWTRFLDSLVATIIGFDNNTKDFDDVNVEHLQLLLLLFHGLPLMHRNPLLLKVAISITKVAEAFQSGPVNGLEEHVPLPLSKLVLLMDYLLHYFYDPPAQLMEQIQHNLFAVFTTGSGKVSSSKKDKEISTSTRFCVFREVEENYVKNMSSHEAKDNTMKPRFYNLGPVTYSNQGAPKVDGLACSFLLSHPESMSYDDFYAACILLLGAGSKADKSQTHKFTLLNACSVQYHFLLLWRLLACLPPSIRFLATLEQATLPLKNSQLLHTLRWVPRLANKTFQTWTKDFIVKQGLSMKQSEALLASVVKSTNNVAFDIRLAVHFIQDQIAVMPLVGTGEILPQTDLPSLSAVYMMDAVLAKIQVSLDDLFSKSDLDNLDQAISIAQELLPGVFLLIEAYTVYIRSCLLNQVKSPTTDANNIVSPATLRAYGSVMSVGSSRSSRLSTLGTTMMGLLPGSVRSVVEKWGNQVATEFPIVGAWRNAFANDLIPVENYMDAIQMSHFTTLSNQGVFTLNSSLKHVLNALVRFCGDLIIWCPGETGSKEMTRVLFPLMFDASTEYLAEFSVMSALERVLGTVDSEAFSAKIYDYAISTCHDLIISHSSPDSMVDERVLHECLTFMENQLNKPGSKEAMERFFTAKADLVGVLLSAANDHLTLTFGTKVLQFFNKLFHLAEKDPTDKCYQALCGSLSKLAQLDRMMLQQWLSKMIMGNAQNLEDGSKMQENRILLLSLTSYIVKEKSHVGEEVSKAILSALIPMGSQILSPTSEGIGFSELMVVMATLAGAGSGSGHAALFEATTGWLELCKSYLIQKNVLEKIQENVTTGKHQTMLESTRYLLSYIGDILSALKQMSDRTCLLSPPYEADSCLQEPDSDWVEDLVPEEDDSMAEDSDEESLNSKLCTFTITQREYVNQHWYHCHTCKMVDGIGVCTICAKVCHKDHDLSYAKFGSFFCDCGAKEDGSCQALVKRSSQSGMDLGTSHTTAQSPFSMETMLPSSLRRRLSSPGPADKHDAYKQENEKVSKARDTLCKQIVTCKDALTTSLDQSSTLPTILELLQSLMPAIVEHYEKKSPLGSSARAQQALEELQTQPKTIEHTDTLMTATLGSQEGAFENVKMNYSGDQGQTIRQLISSHVLRRIAMCCLSSPYGKRQHLAVSHEKGKVTILQLSALLKQADSSKRKLTLTRLASAPISFTVLSIAGNPCNEDFLAVCGLKDCHVLTFNSSGAVSDHLVLHPSLDTGNFIIRALWLPGSQTELAIVTADFVKIYNLAEDAISPHFYFLLPSGKIRDATFIFTDDRQYLVLMASSGYIYTQHMDELSSAKHGPFYITNILDVKHPDIKDSNGQVGGGGVSVYYSHSLKLLLFSYSSGKSFAASISRDMDKLPMLFQLTFKSSNGGKSGGNSQALVQWMEVANHPGLICCMTQTSNNPIVIMIRPETFLIQEIKILPAKAKIQDMVAIRHSGSNSDQRTTLILLCEDGSLRIYMANTDQTNYWMVPGLQPHGPISVLKPTLRKKKLIKTGKPAGQVSFPVDFFEHAQLSTDIEFGGNDVLQVYNTAQIKNRLNTAGMYIASTKPGGFSMEIVNTVPTMVIVGLRVLVGSQSVERSPAYLEVFGRATQITANRSRWVDLPFTREESLTADKKMTLFVGGSVDTAGVTMVDSIKVYVKTKEGLGWPEDQEDFAEVTTPKVAAAITTPGFTLPESEASAVAPIPLTSLDRLVASSLEVLDGCFVSSIQLEDKDPVRQTALDLATRLLNLPTPIPVQQHTKSLLASLFSGKPTYHVHKDQAQLRHVMNCLQSATGVTPTPDQPQTSTIDAEAFQHLLLMVRSIAVTRPHNLVRFAEQETCVIIHPCEGATDNKDPVEARDEFVCFEVEELQHVAVHLVETFWHLHASRPANSMIAPVCLPGLTHIEATIGALVEIIHAFTTCNLDTINIAVKIYMKLLLSEHTQVSFACKQALIKVLRPRHKRKRVFIPSPPRCSTPGGAGEEKVKEEEEDEDAETPQHEVPPPLDPNPPHEESLYEPPEPLELESVEQGGLRMPQGGLRMPQGGLRMPQASALEALLAGGAQFPPMLDIPPDADDETMVELAIALSLQDQDGQGGRTLGLQGFNLRHEQQPGSLEVGHLSDTTASAPGSDDEAGSTAATVGSNLRTSPAEHAGSAGSESGGSNVDSVSVSGRSSAYGDTATEGPLMSARSETSSVGQASAMGLTQYGDQDQDVEDTTETETDLDTGPKLHALRLLLLTNMVEYIPQLSNVGGVRAIPFMQVVLMLTSDLDSDEDKDRGALDVLLTALISQLNMAATDKTGELSSRSLNHEVQLVIMRLLSVLMSRTKAGTKTSAESSSSFLSRSTGLAMIQSGGLPYCLATLKSLLHFWQEAPPEEPEGSVVTGQLLKPHPMTPPPDMSPFFLRQYVKTHANDVFEDYPRLLTEMVLRLPYQMKKIAENTTIVTNPNFEQTWFHVLAEYLMTQQAPFVRRQVRKLLLYICGSKDKYRQLRDLHTLETHMAQISQLCDKVIMQPDKLQDNAIALLPYDVLISLMEHLKACAEVATTRTSNWQKFCQKEENVLAYLVQASIMLDEGVAPVILQLLQCALCGAKAVQTTVGSSSPSKSNKRDKEKEKEKEKDKDDEHDKIDEALCHSLVQLVSYSVDRELLVKFIRWFLLESNSSAVRWQAHSLVLHIYKNSSPQQQESLLDQMWTIWPDLPVYGRKAAQFVDLLGYFAIKTPQSSENKARQYVEKAVAVLRGQNNILANHSNGSLYNMLQGLVDFDGFYLESDPCLVCNNPEVPFSNIKLSAIKVDSKFTTTTQIVKLVGSHTISKITVRLSDVKRTKMVRSMNFYYNNRSVQAVVELKNKPGLWHKAKKVVLTAGQTDVKVDFPLPIVACNMMVEYGDFYDNLQASAETLQCPRCSASVPANPGVCGNCGENVFQCHKCRAINYDEKDPFLCNACGFCKYAKFDFTLTARPCCAVDPIENEDDRKKAVSTINTLLDKADRLYKQLQHNKPALEALLIKISEHGSDRLQHDVGSSMPVAGPVGSGPAAPGRDGSAHVNRSIYQLAQRYCGDCRNTFDELSKLVQKVLASRKELVEYDRQQREAATKAALALPCSAPTTPTISPRGVVLKAREVRTCDGSKPKERLSRCYGCASATVEHCITMLRALCTNSSLKNYLCSQGLIKELVEYNLRRGTPNVRNDVRHLLCLLTRDNPVSTEELNLIILHRVNTAIKGHLSNLDFAGSVRHEMLLLASTVHREDRCWEQRLRAVMRLFLLSMKVSSPAVLECVALPCLRTINHLVRPPPPTSKKNKDKNVDSLCTVKSGLSEVHIDMKKWLSNDANASYASWKSTVPSRSVELVCKKKKDDKPPDKAKKDIERRVIHIKYLVEKYGFRWRQRVRERRGKALSLMLVDQTWLRQALFSVSSMAARQSACNIIESLCQTHERKRHILDLLTGYLDEIGYSGESSTEFLAMYKRLISSGHWKFYLALKGVLSRIGTLITKEIEELNILEETTLNSDLSQGYALKALTELLASFVEQTSLKQHYKSRLVGTVLNGYLSLKKLVVQRTKLIDDTQDKLLELLEEMTTGTESETKEFMFVCIQTVNKYPLTDFLSPVFIFERLCSIIYPEENDVGEFFITLEKDPQQEDFLQGRMLGNPYSSNEPGLGPLMRDVKNKICQDCELVALLEDDTGMELLVCNKIISLDLPVKDIFKKMWISEHGEGDPMRVVYRMRGLLGDATEDMINTLDTGKDEDVDNEEVFKMAAVMSQNGGLQVLLQRLASIRDLVTGKQLMQVVLKLLSFCVKVKVNREQLLKPESNTLSIMLGALNLALLAEQEGGTSTKGQTLTEQVLQIMESILQEASQQPPELYKEFSKLCGDTDQLIVLLDRINSPFVRANASVLQVLMRLIPFLAFGDHNKMLALTNHFKPYLDFNKFDFEHTQDDQIHLDCFCVIALGIENNANGHKLKDLLLEKKIVQDCVDYIQLHAPQIITLLATDSENWKEFICKPALPYVLRILTGISKGHDNTQLLLSTSIIPIVHKLEQASSDEHVGSLAENLMEAIKEHQHVAQRVEDVRQETKAEKKRLAMAMRKKQLGALGMQTNEKGQVTVKSSVLEQMEDLKEETGLVCCICREGYRYQPNKVLAIYTYTKRVNMEDFERKQRRAQGYSTVSHFNTVHVDCHLAAVRLARAREEWESAALQNANTRCNGLLPLWGPQVPESGFANCLARHNTYLQECTGVREASYTYTIHDIKHLLLKFAREKSFSEDSGGGGRESNINLLPYLIHVALYVMNTTRSVAREEKNLGNFLRTPLDKWVETSFEVDGPLYWITMATCVLDRDKWMENRLTLFKRLLVLTHARNVMPSGATSLSDKTPKEYSAYKPYLLFFGLANTLPNIIFKRCSLGNESTWAGAAAEYIRQNDQNMLENGKKILSTYEQEILPCESFGEFCDVVGLLEEIPNPDSFLKDLLASLP